MNLAAIRAAEAILAVYRTPFEARRKGDGSPVTEADHRAEALILETLAPTGIPVLAEESVEAGHIPALGARFFCVDPLDGTKEFLKRNGEFTVNIGLVENGRAVCGVVLAPATGDIYWGGKEGSFAGKVENDRIVGERAIHAASAGPMRVVASRSHGHDALAELCGTLGVEEDVSVGSSLKFCLLATGAARLYPRFTPTMEWDTAAGEAVLQGAGGTVLEISGAPLRYGRPELKFTNPFFVAAADAGLAERAAAEMRRLVPGQ
jgi:3'(2'),5'-bisphosphate nucleotidase